MDTSKPSLSAGDLLGGMIIGICLTYILYGITCVQTYVYIIRSERDPPWMKCLVCAIWTIDTIQSAFITRQLYFYSVIAFGDYKAILAIDWSIPVCLYSGDLVVTLSQSFYIRRIWFLSGRSRLLTCTLIGLLIVRIGFLFTAAAYTRVDRTWSSFHGSHAWANLTVIVANSLSAVVDGTIALVMIYFLKQNRTGVERTDNAIRWIMAYTVNSGAITMFGSIAIIITFHAMENSLLFAGVVLVVSKLYANSLLGALNSRHLVRKKLNHQTTAITGVLTTPHFNINVFATDSSPTQSVLQGLSADLVESQLPRSQAEYRLNGLDGITDC